MAPCSGLLPLFILLLVQTYVHGMAWLAGLVSHFHVDAQTAHLSCVSTTFFHCVGDHAPCVSLFSATTICQALPAGNRTPQPSFSSTPSPYLPTTPSPSVPAAKLLKDISCGQPSHNNSMGHGTKDGRHVWWLVNAWVVWVRSFVSQTGKTFGHFGDHTPHFTPTPLHCQLFTTLTCVPAFRRRHYNVPL